MWLGRGRVDPDPRVVLHADEVALEARRGGRRPSRRADSSKQRDAAGSSGRAGSSAGSCRQTPTCGEPAPARSARTAARCASISARSPAATHRVALARREHPLEVAEERDDLRLVDRARVGHEVAEVARDALAVALEAVDRVGREPAAALGEPAREREVVQRDEGGQAELGERRRARAGSGRAPRR